EEGGDEVWDLERDRERVDPSARAEVVGGDDFADESEDSGESGCERENRCRPGQAPARVSPVHVASIRRASADSREAPTVFSLQRLPRRLGVQPPLPGGAPSHLPLRPSLATKSAPVWNGFAPKAFRSWGMPTAASSG